MNPSATAGMDWPSLVMMGVGVIASVLWGRTAYQLSALAKDLTEERKARQDDEKASAARRALVWKRLTALDRAVTRIATIQGTTVDLGE